MKNIILKTLKFLGIFLAIILIVVFSMIGSYSTGINNLNKLKQVSQKFNEDVTPSDIIGNVITIEQVNRTIAKFKQVDRDIFTNTNLDFKKMSNYTNSDIKTINLTYGEYAYLLNSLSNVDNFIATKNINNIVKDNIFVGAEKTKYYEKYLFKIDLSDIIKAFSLKGTLENNFYLSVSKNYNNFYLYKVNNLDDDTSEAVISIFDEIFPSIKKYNGYTVESLGEKLFLEYKKMFPEFENFVKIDIIIE